MSIPEAGISLQEWISQALQEKLTSVSQMIKDDAENSSEAESRGN